MERTSRAINLRSIPAVVSIAGIAVVGALGVAAPAAARGVETSHKPGTDFSRYRTYSWEEHPGLHAQHPLAQGSDLDVRIRRVADALLAEKGFEKLEEGEADLTVNFVAFVEDELEIEGVNIHLAPHVSWIGDPDEHSQRSHQKNTLVFEIRDRKSDALIWSGWSADAAPTIKRLRKKAGSSVRRILARFPPER